MESECVFAFVMGAWFMYGVFMIMEQVVRMLGDEP